MVIIPHSRPWLDEHDSQAVQEVLHSGQLAQGSKVREFETRMAQLIGVPDAVAVHSGSAALHLALLALGVGEGDHVILPSYVCSALLNAVNAVRAVPIVVDIDRETFNISSKAVADKICEKTKAIIVPHLFGMPADLEALRRFNLPLIEDCAQALGSTYQNRPVGSWGTLAVFSFYATKVITTGEGGMVLSQSRELLDKIRDLRAYDNRTEYRMRFNYKMTDLQAALGISQLSKLPRIIQRRRTIARRYFREFAQLPVRCPADLLDRTHIFYRFVVKVRGRLANILKESASQGVQCQRPVFRPLHRYLNLQGFPATDAVYQKALSVPIYPALREEEIDKIIACVRETIG
ncbi:MAG: DegT/DnrJ/EryC1/StrS family aminotransferase, partial [bacterium]